MNKSKFKKITSARLFLPVVCLIAVLLINVIKTPDFFNITIRNGVFYGYVIDVINRASELVILAVGMTLVTAASGGQDISVGAVMAVAAAVCCQILSGGASSVTAYQNSLILAVIAASNPAGPVPMIAISYHSISTSIPVINTLFQNILFLHCDNKHLFILSQIKLCAIFSINRLYTIYFLLSI